MELMLLLLMLATDCLRGAGRGDARAQKAARRAGDAHGQTRLRIERLGKVNSPREVVGDGDRIEPDVSSRTHTTLEIFLAICPIEETHHESG